MHELNQQWQWEIIVASYMVSSWQKLVFGSCFMFLFAFFFFIRSCVSKMIGLGTRRGDCFAIDEAENSCKRVVHTCLVGIEVVVGVIWMFSLWCARPRNWLILVCGAIALGGVAVWSMHFTGRLSQTAHFAGLCLVCLCVGVIGVGMMALQVLDSSGALVPFGCHALLN